MYLLRKEPRLVRSRFLLILVLLLLLQAQEAAAQWKRVRNAHNDRGEMATVVYQEKIYSFGGFSTWPNVEPTNEVYDPQTDTWTYIAPMPEGKAVTHEGFVLVDNTVWLIGGRLTDSHGPLTNEVWIYNISQDSWSRGPALKDPATGKRLLWGGGGAGLLGRTIHVVGGFVATACDNDQDKYHLTLNVDDWLVDPAHTTWQNTRKPMPIKRNHISTTVLAGKLYVIGGQFGHDCGGGEDQIYSHRYDPLTDTWTRLTDLPTVRSHCEASIFPLDGSIYFAGGDGATSKVTILTPGANKGLGSWANADKYDLPNPYIGVSAKVVGSTFVLSGGKIGDVDPRKETYTAPIDRHIPYKLGFGAGCFTKNMKSGTHAVLKNLLYTLEGEKAYTLTSDADWLRITKKPNGKALPTAVDIEATIDAAGLAPGTYAATVTAQGQGDGPDFEEASFCVNLTITAAESKENNIRINAGGAGYTNSAGHFWRADTYFEGGKPAADFFEVAGTPDDSLYQQYRYAPTDSAFDYNIPVPGAGKYAVKLYFVEPTFKEAGARRFAVAMEGQQVLSNYDIYAQAGYHRAVVESFKDIAVNDSVLSIRFTSLSGNALISAIEVAGPDSATALGTPPPLAGSNTCCTLQVWPNPSITGRVAVKLQGYKAGQPVDLFLQDVTGRVIRRLHLQTNLMGTSESMMILPESMANGLYLLEAVSTTGTTRKKLLLTR